jgi:Fur family transcriptional regulator, peroxide stress response regulator
LTTGGRIDTIFLIRNHSELRGMEKNILQKVKARGLKLTPQRQAIIDVLVAKTLLHPSAEMVYREARKKVKGLSLSTVYATLNEFAGHGIIKLLEFDKMGNRYEVNCADHINLICKGCKRIADYQNPVSIDAREVEKKAAFRVTDTRLDYYGYCQKCRRKKIIGMPDGRDEGSGSIPMEE